MTDLEKTIPKTGDVKQPFPEGDFIINLTIDGTSFEYVEVKVTNPNKTIRDQIRVLVPIYYSDSSYNPNRV